MSFWVLLIWLFTFAYVALIVVYSIGWKRQPLFAPREDFYPDTKIEVIVPARNEEHNILICLQSLLDQDYPESLFGITVIDDHSEDRTAAIVASLAHPRIRLIRLSELPETGQVHSHKKRALDAGVRNTDAELIVTTDADCRYPIRWLRSLAERYQQDQPEMIVAPVQFDCDHSLLQLFQSLDFMSMQGITAAVHRLRIGNMANGANLAFRRKTFEELEGYRGIDHLATGDDYLLMNKIHAAYPGRIGYVKSRDATVCTPPQPTLDGFIQQRIRWASKSGKYKDPPLTAALSLVFLFNMLLLITLIFGWLGGAAVGITALAALLVKTLAELAFLLPVARFFGRTEQLLYFPFLQPLHLLYIAGTGMAGMAGKYRWKGRVVR